MTGKRLRALRKEMDEARLYAPKEALAMLRSSATAKFTESVDIAVQLGVDPNKSDQVVRGVVTLPKGTGKTVRVAVFCKDDRAEEARKAGADIVGCEDLAEKVTQSQIDFDRCIATPDVMIIVGKLGKILGPKGLMPNPKLGSVTTDIAGAVKAAKGGQVAFRADRSGIVHAALGKADFGTDDLEENFRAFMDALTREKPAAVKGTYLRKIVLNSTMGPSIKVDLAALSG